MTIEKVLAAVAIALAPLPAVAGSINYGFSSGNRSATAEFARSGSDLLVTLTNTSTADALESADILTAVFFEITGDPALTRTSAMLPLASSVWMGGTGADVTPLDRIVGGEWTYQNSIFAVPPYNQGISSAGLGVFGPSTRFPGPNLQGPNNPDGVQYGLTSVGDNLTTGNGGLNGEHLIKNSIVFTLGGFSGEPDAVILSASFQYGTSLDEPQFAGHVPEPGSLVLWLFGTLALGARCRQVRRKARRRKQIS